MQPIVCGIDFSPGSDRALRCAVSLAVRTKRPLHLVTAVEPLLTEAATVQNRREAFLGQVERDLRAKAASDTSGIGPIETKVDAGEPAKVITQAAKDADAFLIVVGTRGLGGAGRFFLGSTTMRLLRLTERPVLAVPTPDEDAGAVGPWPPIARLVCGVDFSEGSIAAARASAALALELGVRLTLVHAALPAAVPVVWESLIRNVDRERVDEATAQLRDLARTLDGAANVDVTARVGPVVDVLADVTGHEPSSILAVGLRGASRHRPGSTALRLLSTAAVPVLAVPGTAGD